MKEIPELYDYNGKTIKVGDLVFTDNGEQGKITAIYDEECVDIHHADAHQGPVIDSFDILAHKVQKLET